MTGDPHNTADRTPIFAHKANDGLVFCSFGVSYSVFDHFDQSVEDVVESKFRQTEWATELIDGLPTESERDGPPPRIGTLWYTETNIVEVTFERPKWPTHAPDTLRATAEKYEQAAEDHQQAKQTILDLANSDILDEETATKYQFVAAILDTLNQDAPFADVAYQKRGRAADLEDKRTQHAQMWNTAPKNQDKHDS